MCGLCGVLGGAGHWTDAGEAGALSARGVAETRRRERAYQVRLINAVLGHYALSVADWQGASFVLSNRTGASEVIDHIGALWPAAESLAKKPCDPLDEDLLESLEAPA